MRYAPEHNQETRAHIVDAAARLFRERGVAAVGLATVMNEVNLTVGTFYTHFKSKEALARAALVHALRARHDELVRALHDGDIEAAIRAYLSPEHRDAPGAGCPVAALVTEVARHPRAWRTAFATENGVTLDAIATALSRGCDDAVSRADATALLGLLSGTLQLARAVPNRAESDAILDAGVRAALRLVSSGARERGDNVTSPDAG